MKDSHSCGLLLILLTSLLALTGLTISSAPKPVAPIVRQHPSIEESLLTVVARRDELEKLTSKRHRMRFLMTFLCRGLTEEEIDEKHQTLLKSLAASDIKQEQVHGNWYFDVFASNSAADILRSGEGTYPVGALIVKAKYPRRTGETTDLFTVMQKREDGYDPDHGNWEYSVINGDASKVLVRGRLPVCISCHESFAKTTDYVTRTYMDRGLEHQFRLDLD